MQKRVQMQSQTKRKTTHFVTKMDPFEKRCHFKRRESRKKYRIDKFLGRYLVELVHKGASKQRLHANSI